MINFTTDWKRLSNGWVDKILKVEIQNQENCFFGGKKCVVGKFECRYCVFAGKVLWQQNG